MEINYKKVLGGIVATVLAGSGIYFGNGSLSQGRMKVVEEDPANIAISLPDFTVTDINIINQPEISAAQSPVILEGEPLEFTFNITNIGPGVFNSDQMIHEDIQWIVSVYQSSERPLWSSSSQINEDLCNSKGISPGISCPDALSLNVNESTPRSWASNDNATSGTPTGFTPDLDPSDFWYPGAEEEGVYILSICLNTRKSIAEDNTKNNCVEKEFSVEKPRPDLVITDFNVTNLTQNLSYSQQFSTETGGAPLELSIIPDSYNVGDEIHIEYTVFNNGNADFFNETTVYNYLSAVYAKVSHPYPNQGNYINEQFMLSSPSAGTATQVNPVIAMQESVTDSFDFTLQYAEENNTHISICADNTNAGEEISEGNNCVTASMIVN